MTMFLPSLNMDYMFLTLSQFEPGKKRATCFLSSEHTALEHDGDLTSHLYSTGGCFGPSHLERAWTHRRTDPEQLAVLAAENAMELVSDGEWIFLANPSFAFDQVECTLGEITGRFIPAFDSISELPTFKHNMRILETELDAENLDAIELFAANRRLLPNLSLPVKARTELGDIEALMTLEMRAGIASICTIVLAASSQAISSITPVIQPSCDAEGGYVEIGTIENLMVFKRTSHG